MRNKILNTYQNKEYSVIAASNDSDEGVDDRVSNYSEDFRNAPVEINEKVHEAYYSKNKKESDYMVRNNKKLMRLKDDYQLDHYEDYYNEFANTDNSSKLRNETIKSSNCFPSSGLRNYSDKPNIFINSKDNKNIYVY